MFGKTKLLIHLMTEICELMRNINKSMSEPLEVYENWEPPRINMFPFDSNIIQKEDNDEHE